MMSCHEYEQQISALLDGELPEAQRAELQAHLRTCERCAETYAEFARLSDALQHPEPPEDFTERVLERVRAEQVIDYSEQQRKRRPWRSIAAMAACFAVILGVALFAGPDVLNRSAPARITLSHPADNAQRVLEADVPSTSAAAENAALQDAAADGLALAQSAVQPLSPEASEQALALLANPAEAEAPAEDHAPVCAAVAPGADGSETVTTLWIDGEDVVFTEDGEHFFKTENVGPELQMLLSAAES